MKTVAKLAVSMQCPEKYLRMYHSIIVSPSICTSPYSSIFQVSPAFAPEFLVTFCFDFLPHIATATCRKEMSNSVWAFATLLLSADPLLASVAEARPVLAVLHGFCMFLRRVTRGVTRAVKASLHHTCFYPSQHSIGRLDRFHSLVWLDLL